MYSGSDENGVSEVRSLQLLQFGATTWRLTWRMTAGLQTTYSVLKGQIVVMSEIWNVLVESRAGFVTTVFRHEELGQALVTRQTRCF